MFIKRVLLGSVASLVALSGAKAADAIVAAAPEPAEYVRVCDAFGTGYFYIPGTETCLKFSGEIRATVGFNKNSATDNYRWYDQVRTRLAIETKTDSEVGAIGTYVQLQSIYNSGSNSDGFKARQAYISVGGFEAGRILGFVDNNGNWSETNSFFNTINDTTFTGASYTYHATNAYAGLEVDDLTGTGGLMGTKTGSNQVGIEATAGFGGQGPYQAWVIGAYDSFYHEGNVYAHGQADLGPNHLQLDGQWSSGYNSYETLYKWQVGGSYNYDVTSKLTLGPGATWFKPFNDTNFWSIDAKAGYTLAKGLTAYGDVGYKTDDHSWYGYMRLLRKF
ncbi:porin [Allorhizobium sp. BGMRC 0089]|uniref:porin n=1 Tax=Allorhizobium sonneratiae TaxID=2934936 RepID=UPI0020336ACC|nr:porin [Allorhizobium sonneratiae]MCM2291966.1 porin [Allorhizobium sonneratiae]